MYHDLPLLIAFARSSLRPTKLTTSLIGAFLIIIILMFYQWSMYHLRGSFPKDLVIPFIFIQYLILAVVGTHNVVTRMSNDKNSGILSYHRMSPHKPEKLTIAYILGPQVLLYICWALFFLAGLISAIINSFPIFDYFLICIIIILSALFFNIFGALLSSISNVRSGGLASRATLFAIVPILFLFFPWKVAYFTPSPVLASLRHITFSSFYRSKILSNQFVNGIDSSILYTAVILFVYGGIGAYFLLRSVAFEGKRPFSKISVTIAFTLIMLVELISSSNLHYNKLFIYLFIMIAIVSIIPSKIDIRRYFARMKSKSVKPDWLDDESPSMPMVFVFMLIGYGAHLGMIEFTPGMSVGNNIPFHLFNFMILAAMGLFISAIFELVRIKFDKNQNAIVFMIIFAWWICIPIISSIWSGIARGQHMSLYFGSISPIVPIFYSSLLREIKSNVSYMQLISLIATTLGAAFVYFLRLEAIKDFVSKVK